MQLARYTPACASERNGPVSFALLQAVPDAAWASFVFSEPALPPMPPAEIQQNWCGNSGVALAVHSAGFYTVVKAAYARYGTGALGDARVLDFGCGWGRLARLFIRDVPPERLCGCDPDDRILEWCQGIPGAFRVSEAKPTTLPFEEPFDLVYAFSVFTHLGPQTHLSALAALHSSMRPGGLLIATIRPESFIDTAEFAFVTGDATRESLHTSYAAGEYLFGGYNLPKVHGEVPYGETVIPRQYIERHWADRFEVLSALPYEVDPYQIPLALRRR